MEDSGLTLAKAAVGSICLTVQNFISMFIGVLGYAFLARFITQEEMGVVGGLTLLTTFVQLLSDFGLNATVARFVSALRGRKEDVSPHVFSALSFRILICSLIIVISFLLSPIISLILLESTSYQTIIILVVFESFLLSVSHLLHHILLGLGKIKNIAIYGVLSSIVRWICVIVFLLNGYGLIGLAIGWVMGGLVALLLYSMTVIKNVRSRTQAAQKYVPLLLSLLRFSWPIYMSSIIHFLYTWYDRVLILTFLTLPDLGVYNVVYQAFSIPILIATSLGSSLLPYYGMAYGAENEEAITFGVRRVSKYSMLIVSPLILGLAATAKPVVTLFAGQQYESGWPVLTLLSLFGLIYGLLPAFSSLLLVYGKTKIILLVNAASIVLSMVFLPLLSTLGLEGLAVMKGVSFLFSFLFSLYFVSKTVRIKFDGKAVLKILASSIVMVLLVTLVQQLAYNKFFLPAYVILGGIVYLLMIRFFKVLNNEDFQLIREIFGERVSKHVGHILGVKP
ncbi:MAG: oligosaccharide flippase family protein [Thermoproteota archaeon]